MKFKVFFLTISIQKRPLSEAEVKQEQQYKKIIEEIRNRRSTYCRFL
ncbi:MULTISPECIES: YrzI family small protein [unclassified Bacillus cereus group]|nr:MULTISPECIES: YrzI family small protein [unclassified Bacillus cereus group]